MEELTISEVARRAGIRPSAIRYYESVSLLPCARRVSGRRRYDSSILQRLAFIQVAQQAGFTVAEIRKIFDSTEETTPLAERWQLLAQRKLVAVDQLIQQAHTMKGLLEQGLRCRCKDLEECIDCVLMNCNGPNYAQK
ncbi:MerR family transcriptional regulator [Ktedonosporobacter rubrisoli]|uniref:MerR family transcriptional regulator n=1 Tax=Ktedonosporobacter rubrisoli TaxID=2509675 RepID=A0A4V0YZB9_KTERU|nr:MerR family transcriptional regulator [Ktedonosporobacter rubrisoli]QBD79181.1 MerR family transcriptional regulator [Ktedonosporobacter rubrisoli]